MRLLAITRPSFSLFALLLLGATLAGCIESSVGPQGPEGPPGPPGDPVVSSFTFAFDLDEAEFNETVASVAYDVPALTARVVDRGAVLLYFREQGTWTAMPFVYSAESETVEATDWVVSFGYGYDDNLLEVFYEASAPFALDLVPATHEIKMVVIDDFVAGKAPVDLRDYEAVRAYYGLPD